MSLCLIYSDKTSINLNIDRPKGNNQSKFRDSTLQSKGSNKKCGDQKLGRTEVIFRRANKYREKQ